MTTPMALEGCSTAVVYDDRDETSWKALSVATILRRNGIAAEYFYSGRLKKQLSKATGLECVVIVFSDKFVVKDMWTGRQKTVSEEEIPVEVQEVLDNGYYDPDESSETFMDRLEKEFANEQSSTKNPAAMEESPS